MWRKSLWWHCEVRKIRCCLSQENCVFSNFPLWSLWHAVTNPHPFKTWGLLLQGQGELLEAEELFKRVLRGDQFGVFLVWKDLLFNHLNIWSHVCAMISMFMKVLREAMMSCWAVLILRPLRPWAFWQSYFRTPKNPKAKISHASPAKRSLMSFCILCFFLYLSLP